MDAIFTWVKQIIIFYILANIVIHILPKDNYAKYIKFFIGIVLIIIVIKPLTSFFRLDAAFDWFYENTQFSIDEADLKTQLRVVEHEQYNSILEPYKNKISEKVMEIVEDNELFLVECEVDFDMNENNDTFGQLKKINVIISTKYKSKDKVKIDKIKVKASDSQSNNQAKNENQIISSIDAAMVNVKKTIADFYNLDLSNINVSEE